MGADEGSALAQRGIVVLEKGLLANSGPFLTREGISFSERRAAKPTVDYQPLSPARRRSDRSLWLFTCTSSSQRAQSLSQSRRAGDGRALGRTPGRSSVLACNDAGTGVRDALRVRESAREGEWRERDARAFGLSLPPSAPAQELSPLQISNGNTG